MAYIARRFIFVNAEHSDTTFIKKEFDNFSTALDWIHRSKGPLAAGGSITDSETWNTLLEVSRDGSVEDYRKK